MPTKETTNHRTEGPPAVPLPQATCPHCGECFELTAVLAGQIEAHVEARHLAELEALRAEAQAELGAAVGTALDKERTRLAEASDLEKADLRRQLAEQRKARETAEANELALLERERRIEERERKADLEAARREKKVRAEVTVEIEAQQRDTHEAELRELREQRDRLAGQVKELAAKAKTGSPQEQGQIRNFILADRLGGLFPDDRITVIARGAAGADVVQVVRDRAGREVGVILWEHKADASWDNRWVAKLGRDKAKAGADIGVLVSVALPPEGRGLHQMGDQLFVADPVTALQVAGLLRDELIRCAHLAATHAQTEDTRGRVFELVSSAGFAEAVLAIWAAFDVQQHALDRERKALTNHWADRQAAIDNGRTAAAQLVGRFRAAGAVLPDSLNLELPGTRGRQLPAVPAMKALGPAALLPTGTCRACGNSFEVPTRRGRRPALCPKCRTATGRQAS